MKKWQKTSLLTVLGTLIIIASALHLLKINVSIPSSDFDYSPGKTDNQATVENPDEKPENIIVFIVDGLGFGHLSLAMLAHQSENSPSVWEQFDVKGWHDTRSIYGPLTDSEASATAMATGTSTHFGYIGLDQDGNTLKNVFEYASEARYSTGIVTDSYIWDGTPAGFSVHTNNEDDARDIMAQMASSDLDILFGELEDVGEDEVPEKEESLEILSNRFHLLDESLELPQIDSILKPIAAIYDEDEVQDMNSSPNLLQLTKTALEYITRKDDPFLLLVESEEMDAASHENDSKRVFHGLKSIQETLTYVMDFADKDENTLVLFTSDHETGGLAAVSDFDTYPKLQIRWCTKNHTAAMVPLLADGPGAEYFSDVHRNRDIGNRLISLIRNNQEAQE